MNKFLLRNKNLKDKEEVDIVDKNGKVIGKATRSQVYKKGLLHPAVNIIVVNKKGQIFIQRRSPKKILPLYWDISASEHVKSGEDYKSAAVRGLEEELSIVAPVRLLRNKHIQRNEYIKEQTRFINKFVSSAFKRSFQASLIEYELAELYGVVYNDKIVINKDEVIEGKFISFEKLEKLIKNNQIKFSPWGLEEINYLLENQSLISELIR